MSYMFTRFEIIELWVYRLQCFMHVFFLKNMQIKNLYFFEIYSIKKL